MDLTLYIGDHAYSSWSLRGWLLLDAFGIGFQQRYAHMRTEAFEDLRAEMAPSRLVPALKVERSDESFIVWDTVAMAETLADLFPDAGHWPDGVAERATARSLVAEMHSGFTALRSACPMNMRRAYAGFDVSESVQADLTRLTDLWGHARSMSPEGPFLFGAFSAVDAFYAPVASRIATYGLPLGSTDAAYVAAILAHPSVQRWIAMARADTHIQDHYEFDYQDRANPHMAAG